EPEAGRLITVSDLIRPQREGVPPPTRRELMPSPEASRPSGPLSTLTSSIAAADSTVAIPLKSLRPATAHLRLAVDNTIHAADIAIRVAEEAMHTGSLAPVPSPEPSKGDNSTQLVTLGAVERHTRL